MNKKITVILFIVFVILIVILILKGRFRNTGGTTPFKNIEIKTIEIGKGKNEVIKLSKDKNIWHVGRWPADVNTVNKILESIKKIRLADIISIRREKYPDFEVPRESGVVVNMITSKNDKVKLYVGKRSAEWTKSFLRIENNPAVYLIDSVNKSIFDADFKDKTVIRINKDKIEMVEINYDGKSFSFDNSHSDWDKLLTALNLKAIDFIEDIKKIKKSYMEINLKSNLYQIIKENEKYFIKPSASELIYEVNSKDIEKIRDLLLAQTVPKK